VRSPTAQSAVDIHIFGVYNELMKRIITKAIVRNRFGLLETTDKLGLKHKFFVHRIDAAIFLKRLHSLRLARG
jgi:hypothetical protein